ncbi:MAG: ATP-binding protein [Solirubrobacteraceae bacterium]
MRSARSWERHVPASPPTVVPTLRRELVDYARFLGASDETCDAIALAVSEALTNVVQHAYVGQEPGPLIVEARREGHDQLLVRVCDEGRGPTPRADSPGLGVGLGVMAQTADDFSISNRQDTRGTVVTLRFSLPSTGQNPRQLTTPGIVDPAAQI